MKAWNGKSMHIVLALALIGVGVFGFSLLTNPTESMAQQQSRFMGGNPSVVDSEDVNTLRLLFPAGSRSNWHSHSWGQLLMAVSYTHLTLPTKRIV